MAPSAAKPWPRRVGLAVAVALLAVTTYAVNRVFPGWAYPLWNTGVALALVGVALRCGLTRHDLGLHVSRRSVAVGGLAVAGVALVYGTALVVPAWRDVFADDRTPAGLGAMLFAALVRIPFGTVLLEEVAFRGVLPALLGGPARDPEAWRWRPVLGAAALFGLWHVLPSLGLAESNAALAGLPSWLVPAAACVAAAGAGVVLSAWRRAGRGLAAPMITHLATNSGAIVVAWLVAV